VLTTHELTEAERMADRIVILAKGRIVLEGTPRELATSGTGTATDPAVAAVSFGAPPGLDAAALAAAVGPGTSIVEATPGRYRVETRGTPGPALAAAVTAFLAERGVALTDLVVGRTLEDVYFAAVGTEAATDRSDADGPAAAGTTGRRGRQRQRQRRTRP
jgi:ABC-2 type transport system ATP-binding protein